MSLVPDLKRKVGWKDIVIAALAFVVVLLGTVVFRENVSFATWMARFGAGGKPVAVFDVQIDREGRRFIDVLFDMPIGEGHEGAALDPPPAKIDPPLAGVWRWRDHSVLRFETSDRLPIATEFTITLIPKVVIPAGYRLQGDRKVTAKTDRFLVEQLDVREEQGLAGKNETLLRGTVRFNYPVDPRILLAKFKVIDPLKGQSAPIDVELETSYESNVFGFRTPPFAKQKSERTLRLVVAKDLTPLGGNVTLGDDFVRELIIGSNVTLTVRTVKIDAGEKETTFRLDLSSPVNAGVASTYVKIDPDVKVRLSVDRNVLSLTGPFRPGQTYTLRVGKGLPAVDDAVLKEDWSNQLSVPNLAPSLVFQSEGMFLSRTGYRTVAIESINVPGMHVAVDRIYLNNLFFLFQYFAYSYQGSTYYPQRVARLLGDRLVEKDMPIHGAANTRVVTPLQIDKILKETEPGLYRVIATGGAGGVGGGRAGGDEGDDEGDDEGEGGGGYGGYSGQAEQRLVLLTDLGLVAKQYDDGFIVWVSSFKDLSPVSNALVRVISDQNQTLAEGRTDGTGVFRISGLRDRLKKSPPYLVTVESGKDFSFLLPGQMRVDLTGLDTSGAQGGATGYTAYLYGERDLYRPGETLKGVAVVRDADLNAPPPMPVSLRRRDPQGRERETLALRTDKRGIAEFTMEVPAETLTGKHSLELMVANEVIGRYLFQVEEFVPDRIKVEIAPVKKDVGPGEDLAYDVVGAYLFGPPAADLPIETRVRVMDADFTPSGFKEFTFRNTQRTLAAREILEQDTTLDDKGRKRFSVRVPEGAAVPASLEAEVTARVSEKGGRGVFAMQKVRLHPYPYYVGVRRLDKGYATPGHESSFEYVAVDTTGKERPSGGLRAELLQDRWHTVLRRTPNGTFRYESSREPVLIDSRAIAAGKGRGTVTFLVPSSGSYRVVLTDPDTQASTEESFYAAEYGYAPWAIENPARVELQLDKDEYQPGESASVLVKAPFAGKLLLTVERDRVFYTSVQMLSGNTAKIEVPVREEYRPNAYVTATLVRAVGDLEVGSAGRAFGAVPIGVDRTSNRQLLTVSAPDQVRSETTLGIKVKADPGATLTVAAVDEGILQLVAQPTPDPFAHFYRKLALGVVSYDTFTMLLPEVKPEGKSPAGGGEAEAGVGQFVRTEGMRRVKPVALWSGVVETDGQGDAAVSFKLPEFQGALRVMVVSSRGRRFGSADHMVRVRDPIVVQPTFPRFLSLDETFQIPVSVRNDTGRDAPFKVTLAVTGPVDLPQGKVLSIDVPNGAERLVYFPAKTGENGGDVHFEVTAEGNQQSIHATADLPVRPDLPARTRESAGAFQEKTMSLPIEDSAWARPGTLRRTLRIGPVPLLQFSGKLEYLLHYPYGCIEQTVSTAFPLIYLEDLARQLTPEMFGKGKPSPAVFVQHGIRRVATMQLVDGSFTLWPGGTLPHPWGTVYATHFLIEAKRAGYEVPDYMLTNALKYLASHTQAKQEYGSDELQETAYALYVLARASKADLGTMDFLRERQNAKLTSESRALLAAAYAFAGNPEAVEALASQVGEVAKIERQTGENFNSTVRNLALMLLALVEARPSDPRLPGVVDRLARETKADYYWTTQETSFSLLALGQFFRQQARKPAYSGAVFAGSRKIGIFTSEPAVFPGITGTEPLRVEMSGPYEAGSAYFNLLTRGVPTDTAFKPDNAGLEIERTFTDRDGRGIDLDNLKQGDLLIVKVRVRPLNGPVSNVVVTNMLPSGLEVENPRLQTTEAVAGGAPSDLSPSYLDLRDDRVLLFVNLYNAGQWQTGYALLRAVTPGTFRLPPLQAEAMYNPALSATGPRGQITVKTREAK